MTATAQLDQGRVSKREFIQRAARRGGMPVKVVQQAYDAIIDEVIDLVQSGNRVTLTGFGKFYPQEHKGHVAQTNFTQERQRGATKEVPDYKVLKFSATREVNKRLGSTGD
ncbi:HU family DNA-binding protein [Microbacterium suaedae]|uniref:HU family DNA-binding protein n=1 Tax=Microbacterium suaedae TaxID=2067813 RepID=UPI000DA2373B|nr:HU family DNA-binding protein [Microbacterium suaedae]